jgi:hypothetical protein
MPALAEVSLEQRLAALQAELDPRVVATLGMIEGTPRRLLAARSYVRSEAVIGERWSWDAARVETFLRSPGKVELDAAIGFVTCEFQRRNPGYSLFVNPEFRSLERQIERWNSNETVGHAAANFGEALRSGAAALLPPENPAGRADFRRLLLASKPVPSPPLAAPGLSRHGQMGAIDFQVMKGPQLVAGTDSRTTRSAWDEAGWTGRLQAAVESAGAGFTGPLQEPYEPWHYEFAPVDPQQARQPAGQHASKGCALADP